MDAVINKDSNIGKGMLWKPIDERVILSRKGINLEFIDYWPRQNKVRVWENQMGTGSLKVFKVEDFSVDELKELEIWDMLTDEQKKAIENGYIQAKAQEVIDTEERRLGRQPKAEYEGIPREIKCIRCGDMQAVAPANVLKYAEKAGQTVEEWVEQFKCSTCEPRKRGKQPSEKYVGVPHEIKCSHEGCTFVQKQHPSATFKQAEALGKSWEEFIADWKCREHREKKAHHFSKEGREKAKAEGHPIKVRSGKEKEVIVKEGFEKGRRGRLPNPKFIGIPKEAVCVVCKKPVKLVAQNILDKAKILGITVDELVKNYKCRSCGGRLPKSK